MADFGYDFLAPQVQTPAANPTDSMMRPAADQGEVQQRMAGWTQVLQHLQTDPAAQRALLAFGTSLLQPRGYGQTGAGQLGDAINAGVGTYDIVKSSQARQQSQQEKEQAQLAQTKAQTEHTQAQTKSILQTLPIEVQAALKKLDVLDKQLIAADTDEMRNKIRLAMDSYEQLMMERYGDQLKRAELDLRRAQTTAAYSRAEHAGQSQSINNAIERLQLMREKQDFEMSKSATQETAKNIGSSELVRLVDEYVANENKNNPKRPKTTADALSLLGISVKDYAAAKGQIGTFRSEPPVQPLNPPSQSAPGEWTDMNKPPPFPAEWKNGRWIRYGREASGKIGG